ncbi:MAG: GNAT family N-acetyltransferase [Gemmatimonadaceae bacterium]
MTTVVPIIREAVGASDLDAVRRLVLEHAAERSTTPGVEHVRADAARLPGPYIAPRGGIWVADAGPEIVGCVALRPLPAGIGEVKRMFVDPAWRGTGVGRALLERLIEAARERGYRHLRLGTLPEMTAAQALYRGLGFVPIERYRQDEMVDTSFFELDLAH